MVKSEVLGSYSIGVELGRRQKACGVLRACGIEGHQFSRVFGQRVVYWYCIRFELTNTLV